MSTNTNNGSFLPFQSYINALGLTLDGTYKLYPSKYLALYEGSPNSVVENCNNNFDASNYANQRKSPFSTIGDPNDNDGKYTQQDLGDLGLVVCGGDINFLNHETKDNVLFNETIIYISQSDINKVTSVTQFDEENLPLEDTIFVINEPTSTNSQPSINNGSITFTHIMLFFNVYRKVGESIDEDVDMYLQDMPMGIYLLNSEQSLSGTQEWITRICSSFGIGDGSVEYSSSFSDDDVSTIVETLNNFAEIDNQMEEILADKYTDLNEVKSYYDNFKNNRHVNVPYVEGGWWYVNGKKVMEI